jgi:putrescine aminotransferase
MKFGFIAHARWTSELRKIFLLRHDVSLIPFKSDKTIEAKSLEAGLIKDIYTYPKVISSSDTTCSGKVFCVFLTPEQLLGNQERAVELVVEACSQAKEWGAEVVGLGAMTAVIGSRGRETNAQSPVPVTTGNSLTVYSSLKAFKEIVQKLEIDIHRQKIVIVGFPGSIALAITRALLEEGASLVLVSRRKTAFLKRFMEDLDEATRKRVEISSDLPDALNKGKIIFSATSSGNLIDPDLLQSGSIVFDIAQPRDVINKKEKRNDVLVIDAGTVSLPRTTLSKFHTISLPFFSNITLPAWTWQLRKWSFLNYSGIGPYYIPSCLGETMTLAMEGRPESFSLGRELPLDKVREIGQLSEKHGFIFDQFISFDKCITQENYGRTQKALNNSH